MTRDEIIEIAQQVTKEFDYLWCNNMPELERFADLVEQRANAWRPASEPPDSDRDVQAWIKIDLSELDGVVTEQCDAQAFYEDGVWHVRAPDHDGWMQLCPGHMVSVVVWRDVTPPTTEGE